MEYDWTMNERVKKIRLLIGKKQGELAKIIGIKQSSLSDIENSRVKVSDRVIKDLVIGVNANEEYIRNGIGEPISKTPSSTMEKLKAEFHLDKFTYSFVYEYLKLDDEKRNAVQEFFYNVLNDTDSSKHTEIAATAPETGKSAVEQAEAEYIKKISEITRKGESTALNTIKGTDTQNRKGKASGA